MSRFVGDVFRKAGGFGDICGGLLGRCLGHVWSILQCIGGCGGLCFREAIRGNKSMILYKTNQTLLSPIELYKGLLLF